jgi:hypothetical protein
MVRSRLIKPCFRKTEVGFVFSMEKGSHRCKKFLKRKSFDSPAPEMAAGAPFPPEKTTGSRSEKKRILQTLSL